MSFSISPSTLFQLLCLLHESQTQASFLFSLCLACLARCKTRIPPFSTSLEKKLGFSVESCRALARMCRNLTILVTVLFTLLVPGLGESEPSLSARIGVADVHIYKPKVTQSLQVSASPSPAPSTGSNVGERLVKLDVKEIEDRCNSSFQPSCHDSKKNMTACLAKDGIGQQGSFLIVQNDEKTPVELHMTIVPSNRTLPLIFSENFKIKELQANKINISAYIAGSESIVLNAGKGVCVIHLVSTKKFFPFGDLKPVHGAYALALIVLITGGAWTWFKLRTRGRHLDGVPYQELELERPESLSAGKVEAADGWDQGWDDDWDEEKAVKSPRGTRLKKRQANGTASRSSNGDGWGNDWDD